MITGLSNSEIHQSEIPTTTGSKVIIPNVFYIFMLTLTFHKRYFPGQGRDRTLISLYAIL
jgi:hypothetical protein